MEIIHDITSCKTCIYRTLLFNSLTPEELDSINKSKREIKYRRGEVISRQGQEIKEFMYLKTGLVKLYRTEEGYKDQIISISKPGDFVTLLSIFSGSNYKYSIAAIEETVICAVRIDSFKAVINTNQAFVTDLLGKMSIMYDGIIETKFNITKRHLRGRIAYILLYFAEHLYENNKFDLPISRREIAELIEMTTENVIRILSEFRRDGIIEIDGKNINLVDPDRIKKICQLG